MNSKQPFECLRCGHKEMRRCEEPDKKQESTCTWDRSAQDFSIAYVFGTPLFKPTRRFLVVALARPQHVRQSGPSVRCAGVTVLIAGNLQGAQ